ncbi:uncharacterized protein LOC144665287 [Oculina patagonica]
MLSNEKSKGKSIIELYCGPKRMSNMFSVPFALCLIFRMYLLVAAGSKCKPAEASANGQALKDHTYKTSVVRTPFDCQVLCENELTCQSYNYFIPGKICELNNRTKEARPNSFVADEDRFYMKNWPNRVPLGSIAKLPADSCAEIDASEGGKTVSGNFWLKINSREAGIGSESFPVYCDMKPRSQAWTLIARFSNKDTKHWMNDSGYWWYDRTEAAGKTTDPSNNADMISPAFWLASGNEFKITRSDDSQHTPLLQTTGDCLGGQTFRSKVTSYGDFRNGNPWTYRRCLGNCAVKYSGQYQETTGFQDATCNGTLQSFNKIGFWCNWGWSNSVMMIGGGGGNCSGAGTGVGVSAGTLRSLVTEDGRPERDFANQQWGSVTQAYALNLWIRGHHN